MIYDDDEKDWDQLDDVPWWGVVFVVLVPPAGSGGGWRISRSQGRGGDETDDHQGGRRSTRGH